MKKYSLPQNNKIKLNHVKSVMVRLPEGLIEPFNEALKASNVSAQLLVESMIYYCLNDLKKTATHKKKEL